MSDWVIPLFPEGSLASSVITTVWVGMFVIAFFNLRFGWVLSGLVVPGYLVPLVIAKPWAAAVILVESVVTYLVVWLFSERLSGGTTWSGVFGRDRFLALVLVSILVRLTFDAGLLPRVGAWLDDRFALDFDYRHNLHSFGLIVISLMANQFWKPGLLKGLLTALTTIGLTWLIVRYGLMELTNFRISGITYLYEGVASSILASPKAYVILVVTAFLASRMNLLYSWEFNGILIPALIALQWYQPLKVLSSFVEAFVIYGAGAALLRLPMFADVTMEGARKLLLFFNISFAYRLVVGWALLWSGLDVKVTDYFGFGYLLSTLMAIKMFDKNIMARFTRATLQVSLTGVAAGSVIGFALTFVTLPSGWTATDTPAGISAPAGRSGSLLEAIRTQVVGAYGRWSPGDRTPPAAPEAETFRQGLVVLASATTGLSVPAEAIRLLAAAGYRIDRLEDRYLLLTPVQPERGWSSFVIDPRAPADGLVVEVPDPLAVAGLAEAAVSLFRAGGARALAIAGISPSLSGSSATDVRLDYRSLFQVFHEVIVQGGAVQLAAVAAGSPTPRLRVAGRLPEGLDLRYVEGMLGTLPVDWGREGDRNLQEASTVAGFAVLQLDRAGTRRLAGVATSADAVPVVTGSGRVMGFLQERLEAGSFAAAGSEAYQPPRPEELLYLDINVLTPLVEEVIPNADAREALAATDRAAAALGYGLTVYRDETGGDTYILLAEEPAAGGPARHWGTYLFRLGEARPYVVQVPRPVAERETLEVALALLGPLQAGALLVSGAHPRANADRSADVLWVDAPPSLFNLVNQVLLREAGDQPMMVVQSRAQARPEDGALPTFDALLAFDRVLVGGAAISPLGADLLNRLTARGLRVGLVDGRPETAGYGIGRTPASLYLAQGVGKEMAVLWLPPSLRDAYAGREDAVSEAAQFETLGIPTLTVGPYEALAPALARHGAGGPPPQAMVDTLSAYLERRDILALRRLQAAFPDWRYRRLLDPASRQTFLAIARADDAPTALVNLTPRDPASRVTLAPALFGRDEVSGYVDARTAWLVLDDPGG